MEGNDYLHSSEAIKSMILEKLKLNPKFFTQINKGSKVLKKFLPSKAKSEKIVIPNNRVNPNEATCSFKKEAKANKVPSFKAEIERRFENAVIDKAYKFPRAFLESFSNSYSSLKECGVYNLNIQNDIVNPIPKSSLPRSKTAKVKRSMKIEIPSLQLELEEMKRKPIRSKKKVCSHRASPKSQLTSRLKCTTDRPQLSLKPAPSVKPSSTKKQKVKEIEKEIKIQKEPINTKASSLRKKLVSKVFTEQKTKLLHTIKEKSASVKKVASANKKEEATKTSTRIPSKNTKIEKK